MANKPVLTYSVTGRRVGLPGMHPVATDDANALLRLMHSAALHLRIDYLPANNVEDIRFFLPVEAQYDGDRNRRAYGADGWLCMDTQGLIKMQRNGPRQPRKMPVAQYFAQQYWGSATLDEFLKLDMLKFYADYRIGMTHYGVPIPETSDVKRYEWWQLVFADTSVAYLVATRYSMGTRIQASLKLQGFMAQQLETGKAQVYGQYTPLA